MTFKYETVVPWGRSFEEYRRMFALTDADLQVSLLGCGDGPASFNATMFARGRHMVSCDPLYQWTAKQIQDRIDATYETVMTQTRQHQSQFVWTQIKSPDELGHLRLEAMQIFLADYALGKKTGRYLAAELPALPFEAGAFDLAVCSHFLFLYSDHFSLAFHQAAIEAMCRVAKEARIFPLLTYTGEPSAFVEPVMEKLSQAGYQVELAAVPYEFQRGGNKMLRVSQPL